VFTVLSIGLVAISLAAIFIRYADAPGVVVAAYRMMIATVILLPLSVPALRRVQLTRQTLLYSLLAGLCLAIHFATWISSLSLTSVTASVSIVASQPLWVALFSWVFLGLTPSFLVLMSVMLAVVGGSLISFGDFGAGSAPLIGNGLALIGAVSAAAYYLLGRAVQQTGVSLHAYVGLAYGCAALVLAPLPLLFRMSYTNYSLETFFWIALLALIPQLVGHTSVNYALNYLSPTVVATAVLLEPVGASVFALLLFKEVPSNTVLLGAFILLTGVLLTVQNSRTVE